MSFFGSKDIFLEISKGTVPGHATVNKFGRATDVDAVLTDVWDGANVTTAQPIWIAPTTARTHQIVSSSASDDGAPVGVGARTIRVFGLTGWGTNEVSEDIIMNGTTNVPTVNTYVIIHRLEVLTKGATSSNVGVIKATADTDSTITAQINANEGQTQMCIYGIPSTQIAYVTEFYASFNKSGGAAGGADISFEVNPEPDVELINYIVKNTQSVLSTGDSHLLETFNPHLKVVGPAIMKMQAIGSVANLDISCGFDLILVNN